MQLRDKNFGLWNGDRPTDCVRLFLQRVPPPPQETTPSSAAPKASGTPDTSDTPQQRTFSSDWSGAGRFADEDPLPLSFWLFGNSPRRAILKTLPITLIGPAVNLWGSGSFLLSLAPDASREQRLDTFYPVSNLPLYPYNAGSLDYGPGFKRYVDARNRFEFRFPATYVQDQAVFLRNADRAFVQRARAAVGPWERRPCCSGSWRPHRRVCSCRALDGRAQAARTRRV
jgi:hypothetical protein